MQFVKEPPPVLGIRLAPQLYLIGTHQYVKWSRQQVQFPDCEDFGQLFEESAKDFGEGWCSTTFPHTEDSHYRAKSSPSTISKLHLFTLWKLHSSNEVRPEEVFDVKA